MSTRVEEVAELIRKNWFNSTAHHRRFVEVVRITIEQLPEFQQSAPPLTRERIEEALVDCGFQSVDVKGKLTDTLFAALSQPQEWIKCWLTKPSEGQYIWLYDGLVFSQEIFDSKTEYHYSWTHWQPCYVPSPPVEEESELVKELNVYFGDKSGSSLATAIREIVKRHEAKGGK